MRVLILGASGGTGRELVLQALARGHAVTAFVRKPSRIHVRDTRLTIAVGDVRDYPSLDRAVRNQDAVLSALGHKRWFYPNRILSEGTRNLVRAMEAAGVRRLVCETALGVADSWWRMGLYYTLFLTPFILPFYFYDKKRQEAVILAMTPKERRNPDIIHASRKKRIAKGSGVAVQDVNKLLKQHADMLKMMKRVNKLGEKGFMRSLGGMTPPPGFPR